MVDLNPDKLRDIDGWENAPIHICMAADYRGLTFCCKPGHSLTFGYKCRRDETLEDLGLSQEDFIKIKEDFSKENDWDSDLVCFGSISYCCMRRGGCSAERRVWRHRPWRFAFWRCQNQDWASPDMWNNSGWMCPP